MAHDAVAVMTHGWLCKCPACRSERNTYARDTRRKKAYGKLLPNALVDSIGTRRRIEALCVAGWSISAQADLLNRDKRNFARVRRQGRVTRETAYQVDDLYRQFIERPPIVGAGSLYTTAWARRHDFAPAIAWDEDTIDDPTAERGDRLGDSGAVDETAVWIVCHHHVSMRLRGIDLIEALRRLADQGLSLEKISRLVQVTRSYVPTLMRRHGITPPPVYRDRFSRSEILK